MFDIGWGELLIIGVVALIVIGPKDLPEMFRQLGRFTGKLRSMAREFQRTMEQAANEAGVKDVARDLKNATSPKALGLDAVRGAADRFEKWDPLKAAAKPAAKPAAAAAAAPAASAAAPLAAAAAAPAGATGEAAAKGPATQALYDQKAERQRIAAEAAEKLRGVGRNPAAAEAPTDAAKPVRAPVTRKRKTATAEPAVAEAEAAPAAKPRSRKPKSPT